MTIYSVSPQLGKWRRPSEVPVSHLGCLRKTWDYAPSHYSCVQCRGENGESRFCRNFEQQADHYAVQKRRLGTQKRVWLRGEFLLPFVFNCLGHALAPVPSVRAVTCFAPIALIDSRRAVAFALCQVTVKLGRDAKVVGQSDIVAFSAGSLWTRPHALPDVVWEGVQLRMGSGRSAGVGKYAESRHAAAGEGGFGRPEDCSACWQRRLHSRRLW